MLAMDCQLGRNSPTDSAIAPRAQAPGLSGRRAACLIALLRWATAFPVISHASAVIASDASLGDGAQIMAGAVVQPGGSIGRNVLVNTRAVVEHDCRVERSLPYCAGLRRVVAVAIGRRGTFTSARAQSFCVGVNVGAGSVVAAGAVVARNVAPGAFAGGDREALMNGVIYRQPKTRP